MNKFIEKLIGRLEEAGQYHLELSEANKIDVRESHRHKSFAGVYGNAISIVNELAEEYKQCTLCYLQSPCEYQNENVQMPKEYWESGWIPCSERLPNKAGEYIVMIKGAKKPTTLSHNDGIWFEFDSAFIEYDVIAWQPLPAVYKEK